MKKLIKKDVDEAIILNQEYFRIDLDDDLFASILAKCKDAEDKAFGDDKVWITHILDGLTMKSKNCKEPFETYYKVLECLGFEIVNKEDSK